ncbi:uncharacterized protein LOC127574289 isoform X3 [Pristis pectinata]|uniref:uncharacterized protein LOC127574289 isoform X3 n=1 Tax=Pristis pectinata TaxID=685728 RepID=UPI00223D36F2|nr:uncharacterized protein LOC127574289 isoform X3 [Pristis pectinata]
MVASGFCMCSVTSSLPQFLSTDLERLQSPAHTALARVAKCFVFSFNLSIPAPPCNPEYFYLPPSREIILEAVQWSASPGPAAVLQRGAEPARSPPPASPGTACQSSSSREAVEPAVGAGCCCCRWQAAALLQCSAVRAPPHGPASWHDLQRVLQWARKSFARCDLVQDLRPDSPTVHL